MTGQTSGTAIVLQGLNGNDTFRIQVFSNSGYRNVRIDGGNGSNRLLVSDQSGRAVQHLTPFSGNSGQVTTTYPTTSGGKQSDELFFNIALAAVCRRPFSP